MTNPLTNADAERGVEERKCADVTGAQWCPTCGWRDTGTLHTEMDGCVYRQETPETRFVPCDECDGAGEWDEGPTNSCSAGWGPADPIYRQVICPKCKGTGRAEEAVEPITMEDLQ